MFDPKSHLARTWVPRPDRFPPIIIDPRIAYGKPATPSHIPADAIFEIWKAENESITAAADWFGMPLDETEMAVRFQQEIMTPKEKMAA